MTDLKLCPFCGAPAVFDDCGFVRCTKCELREKMPLCRDCTSHNISQYEVLMPSDDWNHRPLEDALEAEIESLQCCGNCIYYVSRGTVHICLNKDGDCLGDILQPFHACKYWKVWRGK